MYRNKYIITAVVSLATLLAVLNFFAFQYFWYWRFAYFDLGMHFLGGLLIGFISVIIYTAWRPDSLIFRQLAVMAVAVVLVAGGFWEIFEFSIDTYWAAHVNIKSFQVLQSGLTDTLSDLLFDAIGGLTAAVLINRFYYHRKFLSHQISYEKGNQ
ncbi:MAG: hypothetical protein WDZ85_00345 [Candidatus Paceibacterota bacterium]